MGLFSLFKKDPDKIYYILAKNIVESALIYKEQVVAPSYKSSSNAGAEVIYLLMHLLDRESFNILGAAQRNKVFDEVLRQVITLYSLVDSETILKTIDSRQELYGQLDSISGDGFPSRGTIIFAFCFFVHKALQKTFRNDLDDVLLGKKDVDKSNAKDFPDFEETMEALIFITAVLGELEIAKHLKEL